MEKPEPVSSETHKPENDFADIGTTAEECLANPDTPDEDHEEIKKVLYQMVEDPKILLMGMPDRARHYFEMNIAQPPQGPMLRKNFKFIPSWVRNRINNSLKLICNPKREDPYTGLHLIKQNLERDIPNVGVTLVDHPKRKEILELIDKEYFPIIGLSMGCENQIPDAEALVGEIQQRYQKWADMMKFLISNNRIPGGGVMKRSAKKWAIKQLEKKFGKKLTEKICKNPELLDYLTPTIISGNYGATTAKKLFGEHTPLNKGGIKKTKIIWDDKIERKEKQERGEEPFVGEGIHDIRVFLKDMGFPLQAEPDDPIVSYPVSEPDIRTKNIFLRHLYEKIGLFPMSSFSNSLATAIGCTNKCSFCNTSKQFDGRKFLILKDPDEIFEAMKKKAEEEKKDHMCPPDSYFWILDENFTKTKGALERMCELVEKSGENIRWGTSTDIAGLVKYKEKHGDYIGLVRGGLKALWLGIESREDVFRKRGEIDDKQVEKLIEEIQSLGIMIIGSFIVGLPIHTEGETIRNSDGSYEKLNIWEDLEWGISLNTAANQVMMYSPLNLVKGKKVFEEERFADRKSSLDLLSRPDDQFAHICFDNQTDIPDERLEEIDRKARRMFFQKNGPVSLRSVMTWWDGFIKLKNSKNPAEIMAATYNYWMAKRNLHLASLVTYLFYETVFEKCSDGFLQRYAKFLSEVDQYSPPDSPLNDRYKEVFERHDSKISPLAKILVRKIRERFIKSINYSELTKNVEVAEEPVDVHDNGDQLDVDYLKPEVDIHDLSHSEVGIRAHEERIKFA